jgi:membrane protein DedA with SNARE-associated domain/membrane-associated phospholipid phosphatase
MEQYLQPSMDYLRHHPQLGILFAFFTAFIESLPLLGTIFPGAVTMTAIGALIGSAVLPPIATCIATILGAFGGDCLGFWLGSHYHENIRQSWPLRKFSRYLAYSEKFILKHGGKSIIIGRFIGPTRAAMPLIAGILRYSWKKFLPPAAFAAIAWSLVYMAPGVLLGALAMDLSHGDMTKVFLSGLVIIVGLWVVFWLVQFFFKQLSRAINRPIQIWWNWLCKPKAGFFARLIRVRSHPQDYRQLKLAILFLLTAMLFMWVWFDVIDHRFLARLNEPLFYLCQSFRTHTLDKFWVLCTVVGTPEGLLVTSLLAASGLMIYRQWRAGTHLALLGFVTAAAVQTIKHAYFSPRPEGLFHLDPSSSFPSGHATMSVAVLGFLAFLTTRIIPRGWRHPIIWLFILITLLSSISRIFLGQHWFTDVLGAWFLGSSLLLLLILSYRRMPKANSFQEMPLKKWLLILAVSTLIPWSVVGFFTFRQTLEDTQLVWPSRIMDFQKWWQQPGEYAPLYRLDRFGRYVQPFNVQWAGQLTDIKNFLLLRGWQKVEKLSRVQTTLQRFTSLEPQYNTPLLAILYRNKPPAMFLIKHLENSPDILELRLWESGIQFAQTNVPLWVGTLTYHTPPEKVLRFPRRYIRLQSGNVLVDKLSALPGVKFQLIHISEDQKPDRIRTLHWDGDIFIMAPK